MNLIGTSKSIICGNKLSLLRCRRFSGVADKYAEMLCRQVLKPDKTQAVAIERLEKLSTKMLTFETQREDYNSQLQKYELRKQKLKDYDQTKLSNETQNEQQGENEKPLPPRNPRGLYLHGSVGTGKSLCMDLFYQTCPVEKKRRVHFHDFMSEVHERIHDWKLSQYEESKQSQSKDGKVSRDLGKIDLSPESDAIVQVAADISREATLLCFDEFQVTDIADALIMTKLFRTMWASGTVVVATSNRSPEELYENGLNRHYFLPFIDTLSKYCRVFSYDSSVDYRLLLEKVNKNGDCSTDEVPTYLSPICDDNINAIESIFRSLCRGQDFDGEAPAEANVSFPSKFGRMINVPFSCGRICKFDFDELCRKDLGAADYNALAQFYHTIFISNVPQMSTELHNEARRFITCIDQFYESKIRVILLAEVGPKDLFVSPKYEDDSANFEDFSNTKFTTNPEKGGIDPAEDRPAGKVRENELASVLELSFAFQRAASRLHEMGSKDYALHFQQQIQAGEEKQ